MHELSIALSLLDLIVEEADRQNGRIVAVHLKLGPLSGVVREALASAFDLAREGTPESRVELVIEDAPLVVFCPDCSITHTLPTCLDLRCPACETPKAEPEVVGGRELEVVALEIAR